MHTQTLLGTNTYYADCVTVVRTVGGMAAAAARQSSCNWGMTGQGRAEQGQAERSSGEGTAEQGRTGLGRQGHAGQPVRAGHGRIQHSK